MTACSEEKELVSRLRQLSDPAQSPEDAGPGRQRWYAAAAQYLQQPGVDHWWCQHSEVARGVAEVLRFEDNPAVQRLCATISAQLQTCSDCVNAYHAAQLYIREEFSEESSAPLLAVMQRRDVERLSARLKRTADEVKDADGITPEITTALFEALSFAHLLEDAEVMAGLVSTLLHISQWCDLELSEGGRYPGLYILTAHANPAVRALVASDVERLGPFTSAVDLEPVMTVLQRWTHLLEFDLFHSQPPPEGQRKAYVQPRIPLWVALRGLLGRLQQPAMQTVIQAFPQLCDIVVSAATTTSLHQHHALSCLQHMLRSSQSRDAFWAACNTPPDVLGGELRTARSREPNIQLAISAVSQLLQAATPQRAPPAAWPDAGHMAVEAQPDGHVVLDLTADSSSDERPPPLPAPSPQLASPLQGGSSSRHTSKTARRQPAGWQPTMMDYASPQKALQVPTAHEQSPPQRPRSPRHAASSSPLMHMLHRAQLQQTASMPQQQAQPSQAFGAAASLLTGSTVNNASAVAKQSAAQQAAPSHRSPARRPRQQPDGAVNLWPESQWPARGAAAAQKAEQPKAQRPPGRLAAELQKMRKEQAAPTSRQTHKRPTASTAAPSLAAKTSAPAGRAAASVQVQHRRSSPPSSPKLAAQAQQGDLSLPMPPPLQPPASAAPQPRRPGIMPMATSVPVAAEVPAAELQDDDFFAAAGFSERPRRQLQQVVTGAPQGVQRRTLSISPMAKANGRWAVRHMQNAAPAAPPKAVLNLDEVLRDVLAWDMYAVLASEASAGWGRAALHAPLKFPGIEAYVKAFKPLLLEELRAALQQAHEQLAGLVKKGSSLRSVPVSVDAVSRHSHLHRLTLSAPSSDIDRELRADELVLLTIKPPPANVRSFKTPPLHVIALIERFERGGGRTELGAVVNILTGDKGKDGNRLEEVTRRLVPRSTWHATRIMSWTPHCRQFKALCAMHKLPSRMLEQLLHPQAQRSAVADSGALHRSGLSLRLREALHAAFNNSQVTAIAESVLGREPFALVQGPPGTGKTSSTIGIISALLAKAAPDELLDDDAALLDAEMPAVQVLVCAQSNAAVDELVTRLDAQGLFTGDGRQRKARLVRMGKLESFNTAANRRFHIDAQAAEYATRGDTYIQEAVEAKRQHKQAVDTELGELHTRRAALEAQLQTGTPSPAASPLHPGSSSGSPAPDAADGLHTDGASAQAMPASAAERAAALDAAVLAGQQLREVKQRQHALHQKLDQLKADIRNAGDDIVRQKREHRQAVIRRAHVVASTLVSAGGELKQLLPHNLLFDAVVIDEAAQALEPAALIALLLLKPNGKAVLVGDPMQLPATVVSSKAQRHHLAQSLFERLQRAEYPVALLNEQYRMHPAISTWPSKYFYDNSIRDTKGILDQRRAPFHLEPCFPPLAFFNCHEGREHGGRGGASLANASEAELAAVLYGGLRKRFQSDFESVAVLTPYKAQQRVLQNIFRSKHAQADLDQDGVDFATVDGFQGREADIVIFSCVRAKSRAEGDAPGVGFLADVRRMNVALTRARRALWIVGHSETLKRSPPWRDLLHDLSKRSRLLHASHPFSTVLRSSKEALLRDPGAGQRSAAADKVPPTPAAPNPPSSEPPRIYRPSAPGSLPVKRKRSEPMTCPAAPRKKG